MDTTKKLMSIMAAACLLGGCAQLKVLDQRHEQESKEQVTFVDEHSSYPAIRRPYFEQLNIVELIDPHGDAEVKYSKQWDRTVNYPDERNWGVKYDLVFAYFRESDEAPDKKRQHRNSVQDRILAVSTSRCNVFKTYLRRQQTEANFILGSAATVAGVLGAILPGVHASRNLAGVAGILSGVEAEYNQQYFSGLAAHVIIQGIELRQNRMLQALVKDRQNLSVVDYSMEAAVKDAILFDGTCSTITGLMEAAESIRESASPGLARAAEVIAGVKALHEVALSDNFTDLVSSGKLDKLLKQATISTSPLVVSLAKPSPPTVNDRVASASQADSHIKDAITAAVAKVSKAYSDAQAKLPAASQSKVLTAAQVGAQFRKAVEGATAALPTSACVTALAVPAGAVAKAAADVAATSESSPERLVADAALAKAQADAALAIGRVELLVSAASTAIDATVVKWTAEVVKDNFDPDQLAKLVAVAPPATLANLCK